MAIYFRFRTNAISLKKFSRNSLKNSFPEGNLVTKEKNEIKLLSNFNTLLLIT